MKQLFFVITILSSFNFAKAQTKALTDQGKEVLLFDNGTWKYTMGSDQETVINFDSIQTNPQKFSKLSAATFLVKSNILNVGVFMNPAKWTFAAHKQNETSPEYRFSLKSSNGFGMLIAERTPIPLENLQNIALINAQKASLDARIVNKEYRIVNNRKVLCMKIEGTLEGIKFAYLGYYYSNENGTVQLVCFSSQKLFDQAHKDFEELLNGFVVIDK